MKNSRPVLLFDLLKRYCLSLPLLFAIPLLLHAQQPAPLKFIQSIPLPGLKEGDLDHFAVDLDGHRLFLTAEANGLVEVFDTQTNKLIHTIGGIEAPHSMVYRADLKRLFGRENCHEAHVNDGFAGRGLSRRPPPTGFCPGNCGRAVISFCTLCRKGRSSWPGHVRSGRAMGAGFAMSCTPDRGASVRSPAALSHLPFAVRCGDRDCASEFFRPRSSAARSGYLYRTGDCRASAGDRRLAAHGRSSSEDLPYSVRTTGGHRSADFRGAASSTAGYGSGARDTDGASDQVSQVSSGAAALYDRRSARALFRSSTALARWTKGRCVLHLGSRQAVAQPHCA